MMILFALIAATYAATLEEIDKARESGDLVVIEYYSPTCHFCNLIEKEMEQTIKDMKIVKGVQMFQVDCSANKEYCEKDGVTAFPTIIPIRKNKMYKDLLRPRECWNWKLNILEILHSPVPDYIETRTKHKFD